MANYVFCALLLAFAHAAVDPLSDLFGPVAPHKGFVLRFNDNSVVPSGLSLGHSTTDSVAVDCGPQEIEVAVNRDLFGTGHLVSPADLTLGGCPVTRQMGGTQMLLFVAQLQDCRSQLTMTADTLTYHFSILYKASRLGNSPIVRTDDATIGIRCSYERKHNVSSNALKPTWAPYTSTKSSEDILQFSLRLMTDDWRSQRPTPVYQLGEVLHIEASVLQAGHLPLWLFVDSCVATLVPDPSSNPRYAFIGNRGCLMDSRVTGSDSVFVSPRAEHSKLQLQLDAFRFQGDSRSSIYITCHLKGIPASQNPDTRNKACFFNQGNKRWVSVDGSPQLCRCCESADCEAMARSGWRGRRDVAGLGYQTWEADAVLGPILIVGGEETLLPEEFVASVLMTTEDEELKDVSAMTLILLGVGTAVGLVGIIVLASILCTSKSKM
ncbi:zona pellucida sperm-binding protein 3 [Amia ocellicauda]|uniref:zona pellucida sperm-binding protein 3 n=1 Tax=Amia ocellicauda TaxID=2972642 RepID=UPI003464E76C|nr:ZP3 protein [Amia calva]